MNTQPEDLCSNCADPLDNGYGDGYGDLCANCADLTEPPYCDECGETASDGYQSAPGLFHQESCTLHTPGELDQ